ncbi:hypothetical protein PTSG_11002 [Salpingoeca rosetta]|uniref:Rho-GAP domain-containing protein n=1 Tax=Salpingoeca rosetta (strain ATCC 50818 / BSB-021) TaxID=946362 RepID=F2USF0_SALR5|nr:uncharacterized protein PTSG_11002 [Salpingoeca rosetta]EGD81059.1 hypothetical protein PTSG_11002 [Salpingoeca rosetta]|eukprot:XP_004987928.1 hypothetical protein PTSG_11002 [Salpingoeca rosetta]
MAEGGSVQLRLLHLKGLRLALRSSDVAVTCKTDTSFGPHRARAVITKRTSYEQQPSLTVGIEGAKFLKVIVADLLTFGRESVVGTATIDLQQLAIAVGSTRTLSLPLSPQGEVKVWIRFLGSRPMFGVDLQAITQREGTTVPRIVTRCIRAVEEAGLGVEGIYRVPGSQPAIDALKASFQETQGQFEFKKEHLVSINNVASLLKQFLNALPRSLLHSQAATMLAIFSKGAPSTMNRALFESFMAVDEPSRATALALLTHMRKIAKHSDKNQMTFSNLATCFGPNLISHPSTPTHAPTTAEEMHRIASQSRECNAFVSYLLGQDDLLCACACKDESKLESDGPPSPVSASSSSSSTLSTSSASAHRRPLDVFQQHQPVDFTAFRLVCHELGWYVARDEEHVFAEAADGASTISWRQFKRWWEESDRSKLSSQKLYALKRAARFFMLFAIHDAADPVQRSVTADECAVVQSAVRCSDGCGAHVRVGVSLENSCSRAHLLVLFVLLHCLVLLCPHLFPVSTPPLSSIHTHTHAHTKVHAHSLLSSVYVNFPLRLHYRQQPETL